MKPIIFVDFDGTINFEKLWNMLEMESYGIVQTLLFGEDKSVIHKWMRGSCTSEEINLLVAQKIGLPYKSLWKIFVENCRNFKVSKNTLRQIKCLSDKFKTVLLTDNMDCFSRFIAPALSLNNHFDLVVNSADTGLFKDDNNGEIFTRLINVHGARIEECILIDNSIKSCNRFAGLGGKSCLVTTENTIDHWLKRI